MRSTQATGRRIVLLAVLSILLLVSTAASARPGGGHAVKAGTMAGGGYHLTSVTLPAGDMMIGGGYQLRRVPESTATGSGCCCTYLPCIQRNW
jgi:hypothetical protein